MFQKKNGQLIGLIGSVIAVMLLAISCSNPVKDDPVVPPADSYTLTIQKSDVLDGSIKIEPEKSTYNKNEKVLLTATATSGRRFKNWSGDASSSVNSYTINMDSNKTVGAVFIKTFTLKVTSNNSTYGTVTVTPVKSLYDNGDEVTLKAVPTDSGLYELSTWSGALSGNKATEMIIMSSDQDVVANFVEIAPKHSLALEVSPVGAGTVSLVAGQYSQNSELPVTATAARGYKFLKFSCISWSSSLNPATFKMPTVDATLTATFEALPVITPSVEVKPASSGVCTITSGAGPYYQDDQITVSATLVRGYRFTGFSDGKGWSSTLNPSTYTLGSSNVVLTANYDVLPVLTVTAEASPASFGSVSITPASGPYYSGDSVRITETPSSGYIFTGWSGASTATSSSVDIVLTSDVSITANFREPRLTVLSTGGATPVIGYLPSGSTISPGITSFAPATSVTISAPKITGYTFYRWSEAGVLKSYNDSFSYTVSSDTTLTAEYVKNTWTIMVYMDGDNDLEANALEDLNEMEAVDLRGSGISVIVLLDRGSTAAAGKDDTSNGNWTSTRLIPVQYDVNTVAEGTIRSSSIASVELGLTANGSEELNMADPTTLTKFIAASKDFAQAENTMVVFWDHGSGWRSAMSAPSIKSLRIETLDQTRSFGSEKPVAPLVVAPRSNGYRAVCVDEASGNDILFTSEIGSALTGKGISVIGFDLCLTGMIEVAYEVRNCASYMIASPEVTPGDGWEYDQWLLSFKSKTNKTGVELVKSVVDSFAVKYASNGGACLAGYDLTKVDTLLVRFYQVTDSLQSYIKAGTTPALRLTRRNEVFNALFNTENYYSIPGDLNIDIGHMASSLHFNAPSSCTDVKLNDLLVAVNNMVFYKWYNQNKDNALGNVNAWGTGISVHFTRLKIDGTGKPALDPGTEDLAYFRDHANFTTPPQNVPSFVNEGLTATWCPNSVTKTGLIWMLFYETALYQ